MDTKIKELQFENFIWIDICQPNKAHLDSIAKDYNLDLFQIDDSLQFGHLPKFEKLDQYNFLILRAFTADINDRITNIKELSNKIAFFYNSNKIITIHRSEFAFFENVPSKIVDAEELLVYIIHKMMNTFVEPANILSDKIDEIEEIIFLKDNSKVSLEDLYYQKSHTRISKKLLQITQNVINQIEVNEASKTALQDIKDQLLHLILQYDEVWEDSNNLLNTYLSVNSQRSNNIMKLLTVFSAFFLPLTFIVGVYGMNFENMPELKWKSGYFMALGLMVVIAVIIYFWFKRKKIM